MYLIQSTGYNIEIGSLIDSSFGYLLNKEFNSSQKIIIVDENTKEFCLEYLITSFQDLAYAEVIEIPSGEENKQLEICMQVWETLTEYQIDRKALIVNLGGGVITDMGGMIASLYKRGISFVNIPTTLLAMVDASVGGKTGVDLGIYKNQIGVFSFPKSVFIDTGFLNSLEDIQIKNGLAEMIKHGLISDKSHWEKLKEVIINKTKLTYELIENSVKIKNQIVSSDPFEAGDRKKLNFGHTIGHAIESYFLSVNKPILHGLAVAAGIHIESYISLKMNFISQNEYVEISEVLNHCYLKLEFDIENFSQIIHYAKQDKKNNNGQIKMVLLKSIGESMVDVSVSEDLIKIGLDHYLNN